MALWEKEHKEGREKPIQIYDLVDVGGHAGGKKNINNPSQEL